MNEQINTLSNLLINSSKYINTIENESDLITNVFNSLYNKIVEDKILAGDNTQVSLKDLVIAKNDIIIYLNAVIAGVNRLNISDIYKNIHHATKIIDDNNSKNVVLSTTIVMELLQVSQPTVGLMCKNGLKHVKQGKNTKIYIKDLLIFIKNHTKYSYLFNEISKKYGVIV